MAALGVVVVGTRAGAAAWAQLRGRLAQLRGREEWARAGGATESNTIARCEIIYSVLRDEKELYPREIFRLDSSIPPVLRREEWARAGAS